MSYKDNIYKSYVSKHIGQYKGEIKALSGRKTVWDKCYGQLLPENKDLPAVDLGCGCGETVWWLKQAGFAGAHGVDISPEQIETGRKLGATDIEQGDIKQLLRDKKDYYGLIFARDIIEHFRKDEIFEILSLCYEALKDGGRMIMQVPNAESPFGGRNRYGDFTHEIAFTSASAAQLMRNVGFSQVAIYPHEPGFDLKPTSIIRFFLWNAAKRFYKLCLYAELGSLSRISQVSLNIIVVANKKARSDK